MQSACSCFSHPSNAVFLSASASPPCLGFSPWYLVLEQLLVLLLRGTDVRKNLCCHLDDIIPSLNNFNFGSLGGTLFRESGGVLFN